MTTNNDLFDEMVTRELHRQRLIGYSVEHDQALGYSHLIVEMLDRLHTLDHDGTVAIGEGIKVAALLKALKAILDIEKQTTITINIPMVAPLGMPLNKRKYLQEVWDTFVKPEQAMEIPQSVEMRMLMAVLRSVYAGLPEEETNTPEEEWPNG